MQPQTTSRFITGWLFLCLMLVAAIMIMDGTSSLMESGFSIHELRPITSMVFNGSDDEFAKEFEAFKAIPQFQKIFPRIEIEQFRTIYLLEYCRHLMEYVFVLVAFVPLLILTLRHSLGLRNIIKLLIIMCFGGLQCLAHLYMEHNALVNDLHFVPYRLSLMIALEFFFFGLILWQILTFSYPKEGIVGFDLPKPHIIPKILACITLATVFLQITLGGAVTGLHAGMIFNTFPLMDTSWIPDGLWPIPEWYKNLFEDATTAQFIHRITTYGLSGFILLFWLLEHNNPHVAHLLPILFSIFIVQFLLGVLTLLFAVPIPISSLHYANAILLFAIAVTIVHRLFIPLKTIYYDVGTI